MVTLVQKLTVSYKTQLEVMRNRDLSDEEKQKLLMQQTPKQLGYLLKLIGSILLFISPFVLIFVLEKYVDSIDSADLYSFQGIAVSLGAVLLYLLLKKQYVRIFKSRTKPS
jgi:drug/metabolite transporter (DMT)-like permease